jgi:Tol biopolymer transport system component
MFNSKQRTRAVLAAMLLAMLVVPMSASAANASVRGRDGLIAFLSDRDGLGIYLMRPDGSAVRKLVPLQPSLSGSAEPKWSPDGTKLLYEVTVGYDINDIYVASLDGSTRRVVSHPADDRTPAWSPDGDRIVFSSNRTGSYDLYVLDLLSGTPPQPLTTTKSADEFAPNWSPDGTKIAFDRYSGGLPTQDVWLMDANGRHARNLTPHTRDSYDGGANWSPDSRRIAFHSRRIGAGNDIFVMRRNGKGVRRLTTGGQSAGPAWSPQGDQIAFFGPSGDIYVMNADGINQHLILPNTAPNAWLDWR